MSRTNPSQLDSSVLAAVHRAGGTWRVVVASRGPDGPRVVEAREIPAADGAGLRACLERNRVERVVCVLPASAVVCRTCTLPNAEAAALDEALRLQAEAHLPEATPEHRWALSILPVAAGETSRSGIVVSWPESADFEPPPIEVRDGRPVVTWTADVAALAALLNGQRPDDPLVWLDRAEGAVGLAVTHAGGAVFRALREDLSGRTDTAAVVTRSLAETALSVGHTGAFAEDLVRRQGPVIAEVDAGAAALFLPPTIAASASGRVDGAAEPTDTDWWTRFGIPVGAILAATGALASLTVLQAAAEVDKPSRLRAVLHAMARPRGAIVTVIACLLVAAVTPALAAGLRLGLLRVQYPDIDEQTEVIEAAQDRIAMYRALENQAWSMTKLLSDIVTNTPEGVELDTIRLRSSDRSFSVSGLAHRHADLFGDEPQERSAAEVLALMQEHLDDCRIFAEIRLKMDEPNRYGHREFELSAKILSPQWRPDYPEELDYAKWTLAQRQAGKRPDAEPAGAETPPDATAPPPDALVDAGDGPEPPAPEADAGARRRIRPDAAVGGGPRDGVRERSDTDVRQDGRGAGPGAIPEPLTEAQIKTMPLEEVQARQIEIAAARRRVRGSGDEELAARLKTEFYLLQARLGELR